MSQGMLQRRPSYSPVPDYGRTSLNGTSAYPTPLSPNPRRPRAADRELKNKASGSGPSLLRETLPGQRLAKHELLEDSMEDLVTLPLSDDLLSTKVKAARQREYMNSSLSSSSSDFSFNVSPRPGYNADDPGYHSSDSSRNHWGPPDFPTTHKSRIPARKTTKRINSSDSESELSRSRSSRDAAPELSIHMATFNGDALPAQPPHTHTRTTSLRIATPTKKPRSAPNRVPVPQAFPQEDRATPSSTPTKRDAATAKPNSTATRRRANTGASSARKPTPANRNVTSPAATPVRQRALSTSGASTEPPVNPPWSNQDTPVIYRSDLMPPPDSLDALGARSIPPSHSARSYDDMVIPTVAKQLHQQMLAKELGKDELITEWNPDGTPRRKILLNTSQSSQNGPPPPSKKEGPVPEAKQPPQELAEKQGMPSPIPLPAPTHRVEIWEQPAFASPNIARKTFAELQAEETAQLDRKSPRAPTPDSHGSCCGCLIS